MAIKYLKKANKTSSTDDQKTKVIVENILKDLENSKEEGCIELTKKFDKYEGEIIVSKEKIEKIKKELDQKTKDDIQFSYDRVKKFAEAQLKNYGSNFEVELSKGIYAGQSLIPVNTAGCYIPAGRYAHIASAVMSITTAKVAGVNNIIACSSPKPITGSPTGLSPYLYPSCAPLPTIGNKPPTIAPSIPNFILFLNSAAAFFLPFNLLVSSGLTKNVGLPS